MIPTEKPEGLEPPERIFLQIGDDDFPSVDGVAWDEVTWCRDRINDSDIEYVSARHIESLEAAKRDLEAEVAPLEAASHREKEWVALCSPVLEYGQRHGKELGIGLGESIFAHLLAMMKEKVGATPSPLGTSGSKAPAASPGGTSHE